MPLGLGIVTIGRNEGDRLRRCLESVIGRDVPVVYVDSGSSDDSVALARGLGAFVVELDPDIPFSAARGRNAGLDCLLQLNPDVSYVQFVDGDCEIVAGWLDRAQQELEARPDVAVVCGRRRERFPERSIYNRLADLEWDTPIGEATTCGGDAMMRIIPLREIGGYDPTLPAGEEPELCARLRQRGWKIVRLDIEMTLHDIAMKRFGQWWRRSVRTGYGGLEVMIKVGGRDAPFAQQICSARIWTIGLVLAVMLSGGVAGLLVGPAVGWAAALFVALSPLLQVIRLAVRVRSRVRDAATALAYGSLIMVSKWAGLVGQFGNLHDRMTGRRKRLIEYNRPCFEIPESQDLRHVG